MASRLLKPTDRRQLSDEWMNARIRRPRARPRAQALARACATWNARCGPPAAASWAHVLWYRGTAGDVDSTYATAHSLIVDVHVILIVLVLIIVVLFSRFFILLKGFITIKAPRACTL